VRCYSKQCLVLSSYVPQATGTEADASNELRDNAKLNFSRSPILVNEDSYADVEQDNVTSQIALVHMTLGRENKQRWCEAASSTPVG
jgi:hypothetical protein